MNIAPTMTEISLNEWLAEDLEAVSTCPACGSGHRDLLYDGLTDRVFYCAPGKWPAKPFDVSEMANGIHWILKNVT